MTDKELIPVGRALDNAVAQEVMGFQIESGNSGDYDGVPMNWTVWRDKEGKTHNPKPYSTDIKLAWEVVMFLRDKGCSFTLYDVNPLSSVQQWPIAKFAYSVYPPGVDDTDCWYAQGQHMMEAICRAAIEVAELSDILD